MLAKLFYQEKGLFLQSLHPATIIVYLGALLVAALLFSNPLYLAGLLLVIVLAVQSADGLAALEMYLKIGLAMAVMIIAVNSLMGRAGATVVWQGPDVPFLGSIVISLEAICYGAMMSVRLLVVMGIFCLYNLIMHPDKILALLGRFAFKSALVVSLATRMFPALMKQLENIREVQVLRGIDFNRGPLKERLKQYFTVVEILLLTSLEDAFEIAEAMQARAFGNGRRSCYRSDIFRPRDLICLAAGLAALALAIYGQIKGFISFSFYPRLDYLFEGPMMLVILIAVLFTLTVPVFLSWGWQHCPYIKSKI